MIKLCLYDAPKNLICWHSSPDELAFEAWELMTVGGVKAMCDDIIPFNLRTNVGGMWVSYPKGYGS